MLHMSTGGHGHVICMGDQQVAGFYEQLFSLLHEAKITYIYATL